MEDPWVIKAHAIIAKLCYDSWERANRLPNGRLRKKQAPYSVPEAAEKLLDCVKRRDEEGAKSLFLFDHEISNVKIPREGN